MKIESLAALSQIVLLRSSTGWNAISKPTAPAALIKRLSMCFEIVTYRIAFLIRHQAEINGLLLWCRFAR